MQEYVGDIVAEKLVLVETRTSMQAYLGLSNSLFRSLLDLILKFTLGSGCVGNKPFMTACMERHWVEVKQRSLKNQFFSYANSLKDFLLKLFSWSNLLMNLLMGRDCCQAQLEPPLWIHDAITIYRRCLIVVVFWCDSTELIVARNAETLRTVNCECIPDVSGILVIKINLWVLVREVHCWRGMMGGHSRNVFLGHLDSARKFPCGTIHVSRQVALL